MPVETVSVSERVAASVATLLIQNRKILLGRRYEKSSNAFSCWQCPGGYLKKGQSVEQAAKHHCLQKAGIEIDDLVAGPYSNNIFSDQFHTVTLYLMTREYRVVNQQQFESKIADWRWFDIRHLPEPLFLPLVNLALEKICAEFNEK